MIYIPAIYFLSEQFAIMRVLPPSHYYTSLVIRSHFGPAERNKVEKERPFHLLYWIALLTGSCYIQVQPFSSSQIAKRTNWTGQLLHWTGRAANAKTFSSALKYTARRCTAWAPERSSKIRFWYDNGVPLQSMRSLSDHGPLIIQLWFLIEFFYSK